jgi:hypothetical protein
MFAMTNLQRSSKTETKPYSRIADGLKVFARIRSNIPQYTAGYRTLHKGGM